MISLKVYKTVDAYCNLWKILKKLLNISINYSDYIGSESIGGKTELIEYFWNWEFWDSLISLFLCRIHSQILV
jgi:hypothetical protein